MILPEHLGPDGVIEFIVIPFIRRLSEMYAQILSKSNGNLALSFSSLSSGHFIFLKISSLLLCFLAKTCFYILRYFLMSLRLPLFHLFFVLYLLDYQLFKLSFTCFSILTALIIYSFSRLRVNSTSLWSFLLSSQFCSSFYICCIIFGSSATYFFSRLLSVQFSFAVTFSSFSL